MAYTKGRQTYDITDEHGFFIDNPSNRAELIKRQNKALKLYNIEKSADKQIKKVQKAIKGKKPDYGYRKNYA